MPHRTRPREGGRGRRPDTRLKSRRAALRRAAAMRSLAKAESAHQPHKPHEILDGGLRANNNSKSFGLRDVIVVDGDPPSRRNNTWLHSAASLRWRVLFRLWLGRPGPDHLGLHRPLCLCGSLRGAAHHHRRRLAPSPLCLPACPQGASSSRSPWLRSARSTLWQAARTTGCAAAAQPRGRQRVSSSAPTPRPV